MAVIAYMPTPLSCLCAVDGVLTLLKTALPKQGVGNHPLRTRQHRNGRGQRRSARVQRTRDTCTTTWDGLRSATLQEAEGGGNGACGRSCWCLNKMFCHSRGRRVGGTDGGGQLPVLEAALAHCLTMKHEHDSAPERPSFVVITEMVCTKRVVVVERAPLK